MLCPLIFNILRLYYQQREKLEKKKKMAYFRLGWQVMLENLRLLLQRVKKKLNQKKTQRGHIFAHFKTTNLRG